MPKVYVLHDNPNSPKDFIPAEEYGDIVILFNNHIPYTQISRCVASLRDKLRGATKEDWLIPSGHPALLLAAGHVWFDITSQMNVLIWDARQQKYFPLRINTHGPSEANYREGQRTFRTQAEKGSA